MHPEHGVIKLDGNLTDRCNLKCDHCCFECCINHPMPEMTLTEIVDLLTLFKDLGGERIDLTGGEPLMRKDIDQIVWAAKDLAIKVELVTNGTLLTRKRLERYRDWEMEGVAVSLDGSSFEKHAAIRKGMTREWFGNILRSLDACVELGFYTKINTVVFQSNFADLVNITKMAIDLGVNEHGFYFLSPIGRGIGRKDDVADPLAWLELIRTELVKFKSKIKYSLEVPLIEARLAHKLNTSCYLQDPWHLQILPNGNVYPCAIMAACDKHLANLHEKNLGDIWNSEELWNGEYYKKNVAPLMEKYAGCVDYPSFSHLIRSGEYKFVCLCSKSKIKALLS